MSRLESPGGWTWRVATNLTNSHFRRRRAALVFRHVLELSAPEAAERMGITPDAVRSLTKRGTATLRTQLGDHTPIGSREAHDA